MLLAALVVFNHLPYLDPSMVPYYQGFLAMTHALAVGALQATPYQQHASPRVRPTPVCRLCSGLVRPHSPRRRVARKLPRSWLHPGLLHIWWDGALDRNDHHGDDGWDAGRRYVFGVSDIRLHGHDYLC